MDISILVRKRKNQHKLLALFMALLCSACTTEVLVDEASQIIQKINLSAGYPMSSRASDSGFEDGDQMGVYVVDYKDNRPEILQSKRNHATNMKFTFLAKENKWNGSSDLYWTDKTTAIDVYGYYPFIKAIDDVEHVPFLVSAEQNVSGEDDFIGGYEQSDFLWAKHTGAQPSDPVVNLNFNHTMAAVNVRLKKGEGFTDELWEKLTKTVMIKNTLLEASVNLATGEVKAVGEEHKSIIPFHHNEDYRAVVVPQTIKAGKVLVNVTVDGVSYDLKKEIDMVFHSGRLHQFTIQVNCRTNIGEYDFKVLNTEIKPWIDDPDFHDGVIREYLTVKMDTPGQLKEMLEVKMGKDPKKIKGLKLIGIFNKWDIYYINDEMLSLRNINMKEAVLCGDSDVPNYEIPRAAFLEHPCLSHVVFPDKLKKIGMEAFRETNLTGTLILPEGLESCELGAFYICPALKGDLVLPSTVKYVGPYAFAYCGFTGRLVLPEKLTSIELEAFQWVKFTGPLVLPPNLKYIGREAFRGHHFTGNLIIPQGVKQISQAAFMTYREKFDEKPIAFDGNLELPEGLEIISSEAFWGNNFRGELKLPNSLRVVGGEAFTYNDFSSLIIGDKLLTLGIDAFKKCENLSGRVKLPEGVKRVEKGVFNDCPLLEQVVLPSTIEEIGDAAFRYCTNLSTLVCNAENPPKIQKSTFWDTPLDQINLQVKKSALNKYREAVGWKEFRRMSSNINFFCKPYRAGALNNEHTQKILLYANGEWELEYAPEWCEVTPSCGNQKTELTITMKALNAGEKMRSDTLMFRMKGTGDQTHCIVNQYDYKYQEDQCIQFQKAKKTPGIDILFLAEGFDAASLANNSFVEAVQRRMSILFETEPYRSYRDYFNVYACISLSQENGVQTLNKYRNTRFGMIYGGCEKSMYVEEDKVLEYIKQFTPIDSDKVNQSMIVIIPNTKDYEGTTCTYDDSQSAFAVCPMTYAYSFRETMEMQREAGGRQFARLADESFYKNQYPNNAVVKKFKDKYLQGWYQNLSLSAKADEVSWKDFILDPDYSGIVDIYEGGFGYSRLFYRSENESCMTGTIRGYDIASRIEIVKRILNYSGEGFTMEKFRAKDRP